MCYRFLAFSFAHLLNSGRLTQAIYECAQTPTYTFVNPTYQRYNKSNYRIITLQEKNKSVMSTITANC